LDRPYGVRLDTSLAHRRCSATNVAGYSQKQGEFDDSTRIGRVDVISFLKKWASTRRS
jgi:hypothetical protein